MAQSSDNKTLDSANPEDILPLKTLDTLIANLIVDEICTELEGVLLDNDAVYFASVQKHIEDFLEEQRPWIEALAGHTAEAAKMSVHEAWLAKAKTTASHSRDKQLSFDQQQATVSVDGKTVTREEYESDHLMPKQKGLVQDGLIQSPYSIDDPRHPYYIHNHMMDHLGDGGV